MSYAMLNTKKIISACKSAIAERNLWVINEREKRIIALMKPRWFFSPRTREEAITYMKSTPPESLGISEWDEFEYYGLLNYNRVKALLTLAEVANRSGQYEINVSADDVYALGLKEYL